MNITHMWQVEGTSLLVTVAVGFVLVGEGCRGGWLTGIGYRRARAITSRC